MINDHQAKKDSFWSWQLIVDGSRSHLAASTVHSGGVSRGKAQWPWLLALLTYDR